MLNSKYFLSHRLVLLSFFLLFMALWSGASNAEEQITVKPGQTLIKIMRQVYPDQRSRWPVLMRQIVQDNPSAFENGDPRTLKVGSSITLPEKSTKKVVTKKRARAATVKSITGSATLFDDKKKTQQIKSGTQVYVGDQLLTSDSGQITLGFVDGATLELRCNSLLNIEEYKMRTRGSQAALSLLKGSVGTKTGRIGKRGHDKYQLTTPTATIITTQAEYGVRVHQAKACGKQADVESDGLYIDVLAGQVVLSNDAGEMTVSSGDAAVAEQRSVTPTSAVAFSGMVFGDKFVAKPVVVKSKPVYKEVEAAEEEPLEEDNGVPYWWMIAAALILGVTF